MRAGGGALRAQMLHEAHAPPLAGTSVTTRSPWQADHLPPAGRSLPVPTRRGGSISLNFHELPVARLGHDFLQVHINLLNGRV